jgi:hypothetical protein
MPFPFTSKDTKSCDSLLIQVFEDCFPILRDAGAIVEEEEEGDEEDKLPDEKATLTEKADPNTGSNDAIPIKVERDTAESVSDDHHGLT